MVIELFLLLLLGSANDFPCFSRKLFLEDLGHQVVTLFQGQMSIYTSQHLLSSASLIFFSNVTG